MFPRSLTPLFPALLIALLAFASQLGGQTQQAEGVFPETTLRTVLPPQTVRMTITPPPPAPILIVDAGELEDFQRAYDELATEINRAIPTVTTSAGHYAKQRAFEALYEVFVFTDAGARAHQAAP